MCSCSHKIIMTSVGYSSFIIKPIGDFKCSDIVFEQRYYLIQLARNTWDHCNYVSDAGNAYKRPLMKWRMHRRGEFIKLYWPRKGTPEYIQNGFQVHIIFLKYRTILWFIIRLMVLKKRAQIRIKSRKCLRVANLFRGIGHSNLNVHILGFI